MSDIWTTWLLLYFYTCPYYGRIFRNVSSRPILPLKSLSKKDIIETQKLSYNHIQAARATL